MRRFSTRSAHKESERAVQMQAAICQVIRSIPRGQVATYGQVAEAAGYPRCHRQVAQILRQYGDALPWHRVLGAGGQLKTCAETKLEQRLRLEMEGVRFRGSRVDMGRVNEQPAPRRRT